MRTEVDNPLTKINCVVLPNMTKMTIEVSLEDTIGNLEKCITEKFDILSKYIIFSEILEDYTEKLKEMDIRKNDEIFVVKRELSNTAVSLHRQPRTTTNLLQQLLDIGHETIQDDSTVSYEMTDGETTYSIEDSSQSTLDLLSEFINSSQTITPPLPPVTIPPVTIPPAYIYQNELEQLRSMGYIDEIAIREALDLTDGNVSSALIYL